MKLVLSIDPSGDYKKGKGKTGYAIAEIEGGEYHIRRVGTVDAKKFENRIEFWKAQMDLITTEYDLIIIEDFILYPHINQPFSYMETPRVLGLLEKRCSDLDLPLKFQLAKDVRGYKDENLLKRGELEKKKNRYYFNGMPANDHERSALRHFLKWFEKEKSYGLI